MKRLTLLITAFVLVIAALAVRASAQNPAAEWAFVTTTSDSGWVLTCVRSCRWERLTFSCTDSSNCRAVVDEAGVHVLGN